MHLNEHKRSWVLWEWGLVSGSSCIIHKGARGKDKMMEKGVCACACVFWGSVRRVLKYRIIWTTSEDWREGKASWKTVLQEAPPVSSWVTYLPALRRAGQGEDKQLLWDTSSSFYSPTSVPSVCTWGVLQRKGKLQTRLPKLRGVALSRPVISIKPADVAL